jgi:hypothetical protein
VDLPHCDAAERSQQREKSRHGRYLPQCCRGDTKGEPKSARLASEMA